MSTKFDSPPSPILDYPIDMTVLLYLYAYLSYTAVLAECAQLGEGVKTMRFPLSAPTLCRGPFGGSVTACADNGTVTGKCGTPRVPP